MELSNRLREAINTHIAAELYSAYLYLSMSAYSDSINMPGFAQWMRVQHQEEIAHALKLFDFVNDRGGRVVIQAIDQPPADFQSPLDVMVKTLDHEQHVTSLVDRLYELAVEESDYPAQVLLQWFISEQVEEEKAVVQIIEQLKLVGDDGAGMLIIDNALMGRTASTAGAST